MMPTLNLKLPSTDSMSAYPLLLDEFNGSCLVDSLVSTTLKTAFLKELRREDPVEEFFLIEPYLKST